MSREDNSLPKDNKPINTVLEPIMRFLAVESAGGIVLLLAAVIALFLANSSFSDKYFAFWKIKLGFSFGSFSFIHSLKHWVSDGLMAIFFFTVGLEVKRELILGELRDFKRAVLPVAAAIGGMVFPAIIYLYFQSGQAGEAGWGIPMATDIAFVVGILAVLGSRVPAILRVFLLSLAIVDDIGAILVIAFAYTEQIFFIPLLTAFAALLIIFFLEKAGVRSFAVYTFLGIIVWFGFHESGIHATIAGVILGLMTPARSLVSKGTMAKLLNRAQSILHGGDWNTLKHRGTKIRQFQQVTREVVSPLEYLEDALHPWSSFVIMPVFALANAGVVIDASLLTHPISLAIMAGLVIGKSVGIVFFTWLGVRIFTKKLPEGLSWSFVTGGGFLGGIGFTMAMFIAGLALNPSLLDPAKIGIISGSLIAACIGILLLIIASKKPDTSS